MQYAYSLKTERIREKDFPYHGQSITCTSELLDFARKLQDSDIEKFLCLYLDAHNCLICLQIQSGTVNQAMVYPREVFKHALLAGASSIILIHNHPSGHPRPSDADIRLTNSLRDIAKTLDIQILDHMIIGLDERFFSFREESLL